MSPSNPMKYLALFSAAKATPSTCLTSSAIGGN